jgi:hypothetical protein
VTIVELGSFIKDFEAKLVDPKDPDDKKWTERWLDRFKKELAKKQKGLELKQQDRSQRRRIKGSN